MIFSLKSLEKKGVNFPFTLFVIVLVNAIFTCNVWSWSANGHHFISKQTLSRTNNTQNRYLEDLASSINLYDGFASLPAWPDQLRDTSLKDIFSRYKVSVPALLRPFAKYNTNDWHYSNHYIFDSLKTERSCKSKIKKKGRLKERLLALHKVLLEHARGEEVLDQKQEAVVLALFLHLLQDLHQPMHLVSKVSRDQNTSASGFKCSFDLGGNKACVSTSKPPFIRGSNNRCRKNLHSIWDQGFGVFKYPLKTRKPSVFELDDFSTQVDQWIDQTRILADSAYSIETSQSYKQYQKQSASIVQNQLALLVSRSSLYLNLYLNEVSNVSSVEISKSNDNEIPWGEYWEEIKRFLRTLYE